LIEHPDSPDCHASADASGLVHRRLFEASCGVRVEIAEVLALSELQQLLGLGESRHMCGKLVLMAGR
jgi:hypothetical protein